MKDGYIIQESVQNCLVKKIQFLEMNNYDVHFALFRKNFNIFPESLMSLSNAMFAPTFLPFFGVL